MQSIISMQNTTGTTSEPVTQPPVDVDDEEDEDADHSAVVYLLLTICLVILGLTIALHLVIRCKKIPISLHSTKFVSCF